MGFGLILTTPAQMSEDAPGDLWVPKLMFRVTFILAFVCVPMRVLMTAAHHWGVFIDGKQAYSCNLKGGNCLEYHVASLSRQESVGGLAHRVHILTPTSE